MSCVLDEAIASDIRRVGLCLLFAVLCPLLSGAATNPEITVPIRMSAPVIDGVIQDDEWRESVTLAGFLLTNQKDCLAASGGDGLVSFACDGKSLYLAFRFAARNNDPGGGLSARAEMRDGDVPSDDNIELVLKTADDPNQVYHIFANPNDVVFDRLWPVDRKPDLAWSCAGLRVKSVVKAKVWTCEMAIPLASIGAPKDRLLVNIARNVPGSGAARLVPTSDYQSGSKLLVRWAKDAPAIQMLPLGKPQDGAWSTGLRIASAANGAKYDVSLALNTKYRPEVEGVRVAEKRGTLGAGESLKLDYASLSRNCLGYQVRVTDVAGKVWLERTLIGRRGRQATAIPMTCECDLGDVATAVAYYYPGQDRARVTVFPAAGRKVDNVRIRCGDHAATAQAVGDGSFSALVETERKPGAFSLDVALRTDGQEQTFARAIELETKKYAWLGNDIGKDEIILPPFTPIAASGDTYDVLLRRHRLTAAALPAQVTALGRDLLAGEAYYEAVADGGYVERLTGAAPRIAVRADGYRATAEASASAANGIALKTTAGIDYDGFQRNTVALSGVSGRTLDRLTLVIPFKDAEVPLWHICTADSIRYNPTGALPKGEGLLWDGTQLYRKSEFLDPMMEPQVVPYIWLGAERRGLSWCINSTCGFKLDAKKPSVRIVREKGVVRVEIDIVNRPVRLKDGHAFAFAFEATPVKMPDPALARHFQASDGGVPEGFVGRKGIDWITLGYFNMWARGAADGSWDAYEAVCRRVREGGAFPEFFTVMSNHWNRLEPMRTAYAERMQNVGKATYHQWMRSCWRENVSYFRTVPAGSYPMQYSDPTLTWDRDPALQDFKSEWISRGTGYIGATRDFLVPSYMDYVVWYHREQLRHGLRGIYLDDMFPMTCRNPDTAMRQDDEGKWHGNLGIFEMRELVRRLSVMQHQMGVTPRLLQVHMTNCLLVPCFAFATSTISWEDHYGEDVFQERFPLDYVRTESLGTQVGCESVALDGIYRGTWDWDDWRYGRFAFLTRTQLAVMLPLGVKPARRPQRAFAGYDADTLYAAYGVLGRFRIWEEGCRFVPCFEDDGAIAGAPDGVLVASWRRNGEVIGVFGNQDGRDKAFSPKVDFAALGLPPTARAFDAETDEPLPTGEIRLAGWDYALVRYATSVPVPQGERIDLSSGWVTNAAHTAGGALYRTQGFAVKPGDKVRFTLNAKGRGAWSVGLYQYQDEQKGGWRGANLAHRVARSPERACRAKAEFVIPDGVRFVRPALVVGKNADVTFDVLRMEVVRK